MASFNIVLSINENINEGGFVMKRKLFVTTFCCLLFLITASIIVASPKININTASINELTSLPGIGEVTAKKIVDYP